MMPSPRWPDLRTAGRSYLLYSLISALAGVGFSFLITLGSGDQNVVAALLAGAVIGVTINTVIFVVELAVVQRLEERTSLPSLVIRVPHYMVGGMVGFLLGQRLATALFPSTRLAPEGSLKTWLLFVGVFSLIVGLLIYAYERLQHRLRESFDRIKDQELAENELQLARAIQQRLLPPREVVDDGFAVAARNEAASYVAGDYFDIFRLKNGDVGLVVADVAGKGMGASLIMASAKAMLPFIAGEGGVAHTLSTLNDRLAADLGPREFVALCFARFSPSDRLFEISNAGMPDPYRITTDGRVEALEVEGERLPLGTRKGVAYGSREWTLEPGERVLMFSDGLAEARLSDGSPLGYEKLAALLPSGQGAATDWLTGLFADLRSKTRPELEDDWTAVLLEAR